MDFKLSEWHNIINEQKNSGNIVKLRDSYNEMI